MFNEECETGTYSFGFCIAGTGHATNILLLYWLLLKPKVLFGYFSLC